MYAIVKVAGFQYLVKENETVIVPRLAAEPGASIRLDQVLLVRDQERLTVGRPTVAGASVEAAVVDHVRADKVMTFKFTRRENYRRKKGHKQQLTKIRVAKINPGFSGTDEPGV